MKTVQQSTCEIFVKIWYGFLGSQEIAYNELFGGVVIQQHPGEGNRKHFHPDADENWVILDGEWEWWIEGIGTQRVKRMILLWFLKKYMAPH